MQTSVGLAMDAVEVQLTCNPSHLNLRQLQRPESFLFEIIDI